MKRLRLLSLALLILTVIAGQSVAQKLVKCSVSVDGRPAFPVDSIYPDKKVYLEYQGLARGMGWTSSYLGSGVKFDSNVISDVKEHERRTYVSAEAVATSFGYTVKAAQSGLVVDFWSSNKGAAAGPVTLTMTVTKREKLASPDPNGEQLRLTVSVRNPSTQMVQANARSFSVTDNKGNSYACQGSFDFGVDPGKTTVVERLYFDIPKRITLSHLLLETGKGVSGQVKI